MPPSSSIYTSSSTNLNGPVFYDKFIEQIIQPASSVSLRCIASGNPLPQITWLVDGQTIPDNSRFRTGDYVTRDSVVVVSIFLFFLTTYSY